MRIECDYMTDSYVLGVSLAVLSGLCNGFGNIFQKKVINETRISGEKFAKYPIWWMGLCIGMIGGSILFIIAQSLIGPSLVPGLVACSLMTVLTIGSVKLLGEKLDKFEILGIILMVVAIFLLAFSGLDIPSSTIDFTDLNLAIRTAIFSTIFGVLWIVIFLWSRRLRKRKGALIAFSTGFPYGISNLWAGLIAALIAPILGLEAQFIEVIYFVLALIILGLTNFFGIWQTNEAYKYAQASNVQPLINIVNQIAPVFVYFLVFERTSTIISLVFIIAGCGTIIFSGFLLGRRQGELESIK